MELTAPALKQRGKSLFNTRTGAVRQWVDNLPLINADGTIVQLEFALDEINSTDMPATERLEALELLIPPVMHVTGALKKCYTGKHFPLKGSSLEKANKVIGLYSRMATGYKILVAALGEKIDGDPRLATAVHRAIRYLSEVLISCYQIYIPYPDGSWKHLHTLYSLSGQNGLLEQPVIDITLRNPTSTTIENIYKQILLLSLACPYRLRQNEITTVYELLSQWAPYSKLLDVKEKDTTGFFTCHLDSDDPPSYLALKQTEKLDAHWRIFTTSNMADPVRAALAGCQRTAGGYNNQIEERILQRLMLAWGVMPRRQFTRDPQDASIQLVLGLSAIHRIISGAEASAEPGKPAATDAIQERQTLQDPTFEQPTIVSTDPAAENTFQAGRGIHDMGQRHDPWQNNPFKGAFSAKHQTPDASQASSIPVETWKMHDMSAGGYCLLWDSEDVSSAQVGELVAVKTVPAGAGDWQLGVVRWMKFTPEHGLGLGIQMLARGASAIRASICGDRGGDENKMAGVLLPGIKGLDQPATLLLPSPPFRTGSLSTLVSDDTAEQIKLTRKIENTGSFAQYYFVPATES